MIFQSGLMAREIALLLVMALAACQATSTPEIPFASDSNSAVAQSTPVQRIVVPVAAASSPASALKSEQPSSGDAYLHNRPPVYPSMSRREGEQGKVVIRALIGVDGAATQAEVSQSSGFKRLDQAALATVQSWRYVPGKRGGVPEAMWFNVPINFVLE